MGLGPIAYAVSATQLAGWRADWGLAAGPVTVLSIGDVVPGLTTRGPFAELEDELRDLHHRQALRTLGR